MKKKGIQIEKDEASAAEVTWHIAADGSLHEGAHQFHSYSPQMDHTIHPLSHPLVSF